MDGIKNNFCYLLHESLLAPRLMSYYGVDGEGILSAIDNTTKEQLSIEGLLRTVRSYLEPGEDLRNAILSFYYSYYCEYKEKVAFVSYVRKKFSEIGYKNENAAVATGGKIKKEILNSSSDLSAYFKNILTKGKRIPGGSIPILDADILMRSVYSYPKNPYNFIRRDNNPKNNIPKDYTQKEFDNFLKFFDNVLSNSSKEVDADEVIKKHVSQYIFERIYHIHFINTIACIYDEMYKLFDGLRYADTSVVSVMWEYEYIDVENLLKSINECFIKENWDIELAKEVLKNGLKNFILDLCEFAIIPDIYTREKELKDYVMKYSHKMILQQTYHEHIRSKVAECTRRAYIKNEIFHYSYMLWKIKKIECLNTEKTIAEKEDLWTNMFDKIYAEKHIDEDLASFETIVKSGDFDIIFPRLAFDFSKDNGFIKRIFEKIFFSCDIFNVNENVMKAPLASNFFNKEYTDLLGRALQAHVNSYDIYTQGKNHFE